MDLLKEEEEVNIGECFGKVKLYEVNIVTSFHHGDHSVILLQKLTQRDPPSP
jgi:hypothetical protein